jgi:general nucleoside transport system ATP-binding protein
LPTLSARQSSPNEDGAGLLQARGFGLTDGGVTQAAPQQARPLLRLTGITKQFPGVLANRDISLELRRGEILGLLGENGAGKTTLMNVVYGLYHPDEGTIEVDGQEVTIPSPQHALQLGIGMVHQHFSLVPDMTVAENVALRASGRPRLSRLPQVAAELGKVSRDFGLPVDPERRIEELSLGERQRVEIVRLLYRGADILILDEPTAALTPPEWAELAGFLKSLTRQGKSVILITHKLEELFGVADRCVVLRDGAVVGTVSVAETTKAQLARLMVGREVVLQVERPPGDAGEPLLEVRNLHLEEDGRVLLADISFAVRSAEIFGVAGVGGNGQDELVETLAGLRRGTAGQIFLAGQELERADPKLFTALGGGVIPEDRHETGVALGLSLYENLLMKEIDRSPFSHRGVLNRYRLKTAAQKLVTEYGIRAAGLETPMGQLSGGNQQKAVFARELSRKPRLLIASQPTRGLDVGATEFVYERLMELRQQGAGILLLSIDLSEILSLADRIAVMFNGRFLAVLDAQQADPEVIGLLMAGERTDDHAAASR